MTPERDGLLVPVTSTGERNRDCVGKCVSFAIQPLCFKHVHQHAHAFPQVVFLELPGLEIWSQLLSQRHAHAAVELDGHEERPAGNSW